MCHSDSNCHSRSLHHSRSQTHLQFTEFKYTRWNELCRFTPTQQRQEAQEAGGEEATSPGRNRKAGGVDSRTKARAWPTSEATANYSCIWHIQKACRPPAPQAGQNESPGPLISHAEEGGRSISEGHFMCQLR